MILYKFILLPYYIRIIIVYRLYYKAANDERTPLVE